MSFHELYEQNRAAGKVARFLVGRSAQDELVDLSNGVPLKGELASYSRMKFGDVEAIKWWGREVAAAMIRDLRQGGELRAVFEGAGERGEHIYPHTDFPQQAIRC